MGLAPGRRAREHDGLPERITAVRQKLGLALRAAWREPSRRDLVRRVLRAPGG